MRFSGVHGSPAATCDVRLTSALRAWPSRARAATAAESRAAPAAQARAAARRSPFRRVPAAGASGAASAFDVSAARRAGARLPGPAGHLRPPSRSRECFRRRNNTPRAKSSGIGRFQQ
jgi:hypothetical protein